MPGPARGWAGLIVVHFDEFRVDDVGTTFAEPAGGGRCGAGGMGADGRAEAASGRHDDDVICLGMGLVCLPSATVYHEAPAVTVGPIDADHWKESA